MRETREGFPAISIISFQNFPRVLKTCPACRKDFFDKLGRENSRLPLATRGKVWHNKGRFMQRYRSGYNGPDSKSGVPSRVPWVRIPPAAPAQKFPPPLRFPPAGRKTALWWEFLRFRPRFAALDSGPRGTGDEETRDEGRGMRGGDRKIWRGIFWEWGLSACFLADGAVYYKR